MSSRTRPFRPGWQWPWLVTAALLFTVGVNVVMLVAASGDANGAVVEPDYYRKGVEWDLAMARRAASDRLGWRTSASIARVGDGHALRVHATDSTGAPLTGARFVAVLIHNLDAARPVRATLEELGDGRYEAPVPIAHDGMWEVRLEARRDAARYTSSQRADVGR
jgi:nitrogen fixation protein FixH